jgi:formylmethanofuran dehydrogenase subunit C
MTAGRLALTLRTQPPGRVNLAPLVPQNLTGKSRSEIAALRLECGSGDIAVSELFALEGDDAANIVIEGDCARLDRIGESMKSGSITVHGDAGAYLGRGMRGGTITVEGGAGAYCASGMKNGLIHVAGDAGDFLAAALPGEHRGMQGGIVLVRGNAGDRVGDRMRRGMALIEGNCGDYCGARMSAGTIGVLGKPGRYPGFAMRRGTLILRHAPELLPTFADAGIHSLGFLRLMVRAWRALPSRFASVAEDAVRVRRHVGDLGSGGKGEILVWR